MHSNLPVRYTDLYPNVCFPLPLSTMLRLKKVRNPGRWDGKFLVL